MNNPYFNLIRMVWEHGKVWRGTIVSLYLVYIIAQTMLSLSPYAFARAIDILQVFTPARLQEVILWLSAGVALVLLFWIFHGPARVVERRTALKIQQAFRVNLYENLTHLPLKWHQENHSGELVFRINRALTALFNFAQDQFIYIETIIKCIISIGFLLWISIPVGLLSLLTCLVMAGTVIIFDRKLIPLYDKENEIDNRIAAILVDYITNMTTILTLRLGELTRKNLFQRLMTVWPFFNKDVVLNECKWFTLGFLLSVTQSIILIGYIISTLETTDAIMIGSVVMIFRYQSDLAEVFRDLSLHYSDLVKKDTELKGLNPLIKDIRELSSVPAGQDIARQWHTINIHGLYFRHPDHQQGYLIDNLSLNINRGEKIALIGPSGSGKSTLLNLLCGLYKSEKVKLEIDGIMFNSLEPLQTISTLIPQDAEIFENTVSFNITLDLEATPEAIQQSIQLAGFTSVLTGLPAGMATEIREKGFNLSGGQRQRLALARGMFAARFSSVLLLDEPTSSVDMPTEQAILSGIINSFPDKAMVMSLHRLNLLPHFDKIFLLQQGKIIAAGTPQELLYTPGPVQDIWQQYQKIG